MAKKKIKDFNVNIDTEKVDIKIEKKEDSLNVQVETPKGTASIVSDGENKEFKLDSKKLDVLVTKENGATKVVVESENGFFKRVGNFISKIFVKKFNK